MGYEDEPGLKLHLSKSSRLHPPLLLCSLLSFFSLDWPEARQCLATLRLWLPVTRLLTLPIVPQASVMEGSDEWDGG